MSKAEQPGSAAAGAGETAAGTVAGGATGAGAAAAAAEAGGLSRAAGGGMGSDEAKRQQKRQRQAAIMAQFAAKQSAFAKMLAAADDDEDDEMEEGRTRETKGGAGSDGTGAGAAGSGESGRATGSNVAVEPAPAVGAMEGMDIDGAWARGAAGAVGSDRGGDGNQMGEQQGDVGRGGLEGGGMGGAGREASRSRKRGQAGGNNEAGQADGEDMEVDGGPEGSEGGKTGVQGAGGVGRMEKGKGKMEEGGRGEGAGIAAPLGGAAAAAVAAGGGVRKARIAPGSLAAFTSFEPDLCGFCHAECRPTPTAPIGCVALAQPYKLPAIMHSPAQPITPAAAAGTGSSPIGWVALAQPYKLPAIMHSRAQRITPAAATAAATAAAAAAAPTLSPPAGAPAAAAVPEPRKEQERPAAASEAAESSSGLNKHAAAAAAAAEQGHTTVQPAAGNASARAEAAGNASDRAAGEVEWTVEVQVEGALDTQVTSHIRCCGHQMHFECYNQYMSALVDRDRADRPYEGRGLIDLARGEFLCPVCRRLGNLLLPDVRMTLPLANPPPSSEALPKPTSTAAAAVVGGGGDGAAAGSNSGAGASVVKKSSSTRQERETQSLKRVLERLRVLKRCVDEEREEVQWEERQQVWWTRFWLTSTAMSGFLVIFCSQNSMIRLLPSRSTSPGYVWKSVWELLALNIVHHEVETRHAALQAMATATAATSATTPAADASAAPPLSSVEAAEAAAAVARACVGERSDKGHEMALDGLAHLALLTNTIMAAAPVVDHQCTSLFKWLHLEPEEEEDEKDRAGSSRRAGRGGGGGGNGKKGQPRKGNGEKEGNEAKEGKERKEGEDVGKSVAQEVGSKKDADEEMRGEEEEREGEKAECEQEEGSDGFEWEGVQEGSGAIGSGGQRLGEASTPIPPELLQALMAEGITPAEMVAELRELEEEFGVEDEEEEEEEEEEDRMDMGVDSSWSVLLGLLSRPVVAADPFAVLLSLIQSKQPRPSAATTQAILLVSFCPQVLLADWLRRSLALPSVTAVLRLMASANSEASSSQPWHLSRMFASWNLPSEPPRLVRAPTQPSFHPLPEIYQDLLLSTMNKVCRNCGQEPPNPAVCLCCGELLCYHSSCCHSDGRGECYRHALRENGGTGLFLVMRSTQLVLIHGVHICAGLSIYLDSHGEDDAYMRRGRPLYLSHSRLAEFLHLWKTASISHDSQILHASLSHSVRINAAAGGSGKGFGSGGPSNQSPAKSKGSKTAGGTKKPRENGSISGPSAVVPEDPKITRLVQKLEEKSSSNPTPTRGHPLVDQRAAAKGRVDFVRVEGWEAAGSAASEIGPDEIGNLKVKSFTPGTTSQGYEARAEDDQQPRQQLAEGDAPAPQVDLYERLVRHLQVLESQGKLSVARAKGEPPLPSFDRWRFGAKRFGQYLVDQMHVHEALDRAVLQALGGKTGAKSAGNIGGESGGNGGDDVSGATRALSLKASASTNNSQEQGEQDQPTPSFLSLKSSTSSSSGAASAAISPADAARLRLFTHTFTLLVTHLTNGMRIGAKAVECLPSLRAAKAVSFFQEYPDTVGDPMKAFRAAVDEAGKGMSEGEVELVEGELGPAMVKASLLLKVLAVEEREEVVSAP
ncbi:unnamed protein product [Closterium sp. NIES-65]|nr:unnamed protein product [Closterium sp. NIES-65]